MRNTFLEKSYPNCSGETISRLCLKKPKFISLDQSSRVLYSLFLMYTKLRTTEKVFFKSYKRPRTSLPSSYSA